MDGGQFDQADGCDIETIGAADQQIAITVHRDILINPTQTGIGRRAAIAAIKIIFIASYLGDLSGIEIQLPDTRRKSGVVVRADKEAAIVIQHQTGDKSQIDLGGWT